MFERYTQKARRVIFFARYESSQFGSPEILPEHILLGLIRETPGLFLNWLSQPSDVVELRSNFASKLSQAPPIPTTSDLPLNDECKRIIVYAAEEAQRLDHEHIGPEHLLLGLLREKRSAEFLQQSGITLETARETAQKGPDLGERSAKVLRAHPPKPKINFFLGDEQIAWTEAAMLPREGELVKFAEGKCYRVREITYQYTPNGTLWEIEIQVAEVQ